MNDLNTALQNNPAASPLFQGLDYALASFGRVTEGIYNMKLLKSELQARNADSQWRMAMSNQLRGQQTGNMGSWYGTNGMTDIPSYTGAGMMGQMDLGKLALPVAIGLGLAFFLFSKKG